MEQSRQQEAQQSLKLLRIQGLASLLSTPDAVLAHLPTEDTVESLRAQRDALQTQVNQLRSTHIQAEALWGRS